MDRYWVLRVVSVEDSKSGEGSPQYQRKHADLEAAKAEGDRVLDQRKGRRHWVAFIIHGPVDQPHPPDRDDTNWRVWTRHQGREWVVS